MEGRNGAMVTRRTLAALVLGRGAAIGDNQSIRRDASSVHGWIQDGEYAKAYKLLSARLGAAQLGGVDDDFTPLLLRLGMLLAEIGSVRQARIVLDRAAAGRGPAAGYDRPAMLRERALIFADSHDFAVAARDALAARRDSQRAVYWIVTQFYCASIAALAQARLGDMPAALKLTALCQRDMPKKLEGFAFTGPRLLFNLAIVRAMEGNTTEARALAERGADLARRKNGGPRTTILGELALSEIALAARDPKQASERALRALNLTRAVFGYRHQDASRALYLSAQAFLQSGQRGDARTRAADAAAIARLVFGQGSPVEVSRRKFREELDQDLP